MKIEDVVRDKYASVATSGLSTEHDGVRAGGADARKEVGPAGGHPEPIQSGALPPQTTTTSSPTG